MRRKWWKLASADMKTSCTMKRALNNTDAAYPTPTSTSTPPQTHTPTNHMSTTPRALQHIETNRTHNAPQAVVTLRDLLPGSWVPHRVGESAPLRCASHVTAPNSACDEHLPHRSRHASSKGAIGFRRRPSPSPEVQPQPQCIPLAVGVPVSVDRGCRRQVLGVQARQDARGGVPRQRTEVGAAVWWRRSWVGSCVGLPGTRSSCMLSVGASSLCSLAPGEAEGKEGSLHGVGDANQRQHDEADLWERGHGDDGSGAT